MRLHLLLVGVVLLAVVTDTAQARGLRLCGKRLTRMLIKICRGRLCGGYVKDAVKRGGDNDGGLADAAERFTFVHPLLDLKLSPPLAEYAEEVEDGARMKELQQSWLNEHDGEEPTAARLEPNYRRVINDEASENLDDGGEGGDLATEYERRPRQKRGVADECCRNRCSYSYLKSYCC